MNELQVFKNDAFEVRVTGNDGEPWFVAADVCRALGLDNNRQAVTRLDEDEKGVISNDTPGGAQDMTIVSESGMYALVLSSRKPEAKDFQRWVRKEVLPAIRKTGSYSVKQSPIEAARIMNAQLMAVLDEQIRMAKEAEQITARVEKLERGAYIVDDSAATPTQIGAMMAPPVSGQKVNSLLRSLGFQYRVGDDWVPTAKGKPISVFGQTQLASGKLVYQLYWHRTPTLDAIKRAEVTR